MLTLAPRSQSALLNFMLPMVQGIEKFPGSLNFGGNLFFRSALLSSVNMTVSCSPSFFFFETNSLRNFAYFGICSSMSANEILICKLLNMFRSLHINISFADMLEHMPKYAKFLKELVSKKKKLGEHETVMLTEESSALLKNKLPPKLRDPGNFSIPCTISNIKFSNALCNLGASINILPYSLFKKLNIGEVKPMKMTLQLANHSIIHPRGIIEDVLVKVDKFIYPVDLVVLDMAEDRSIPLILGRAFLKTARAIIDVDEGKIILRAGDESIEFHLANQIQYPPEAENCWMIDEVNKEKKDELGEIFSYPTLEERLKMIASKEAEGEELSRNEINLKHLMSVSMPMVREKQKRRKDHLPHEPPDKARQQNRDYCFSINEIEESKS